MATLQIGSVPLLHRESHRFLRHVIFSAFGARDVRKDVSNLRVAQSSCAKKDL